MDGGGADDETHDQFLTKLFPAGEQIYHPSPHCAVPSGLASFNPQRLGAAFRSSHVEPATISKL
jgi:hypothetical protein